MLTNSLLRSLGTIVTQENSSNIPLNVNSWIETVFALQVWQLAISDIKLYSCVPIQVGLPLKLTQPCKLRNGTYIIKVDAHT